MKNISLFIFPLLLGITFGTPITHKNIEQTLNSTASFLLTSFHINDNDEKAEAVLRKYIEAIGGEKAIASIESLSYTYNATINSQSLSTSVKIATYRKSPDKFFEESIMDNERFMKRIYNNGGLKITDVITPLSENQKARLKYDGIMFSERFYSDYNYQPTVIGTEVVDGVDTYKMQITIDGVNIYEYYAIESGLKVRFHFDEGTIYTLSDYKEVEGVKFPYKIVFNNQFLKQYSRVPTHYTFTLRKIKVNENIKDRIFELN